MHNINKGDKLEIKLGTKTYKGFVHEYSEGGFVVAEVADSFEAAAVSMPKQCLISLFFDGGIINFEADFAAVCKQDNLVLARFKITLESEKIERREFLRCECSLPIRFALVDDITAVASETQEQRPKPLNEGTVKDIGGGGLRFVTNVEVENGDNIKFLLLLEGEYLIIVGKILHKYKVSMSQAKFQYRVVFIDILPADREKIIRFVFNEHQK
ncbi:MAG: PilZ domain-containing protein [Defluviitaleaceae bacterium]|nr:PilZ domain-containing protein [Defluviitaleaceae bacterium]